MRGRLRSTACTRLTIATDSPKDKINHIYSAIFKKFMTSPN